jgi:hypothetical protein
MLVLLLGAETIDEKGNRLFQENVTWKPGKNHAVWRQDCQVDELGNQLYYQTYPNADRFLWVFT